ncbi:MAG: VOC family protein [Acidobacteriia bacterium]|nr:VOC family protein [Terriglobia bacterium]
MAGKVKSVPEGMHSITPHLVVRNAIEAIDFYRKALGAEAKGVHRTPDGKVMHAELKVGNSMIFLADEFPGMGTCASPQTLGGNSITLNLYTDNVDQLFNRAVAAGATVVMPLANQFWGDRYGQIKDPFGHTWALGQHVEDVTPEEMERRGREAFAQMAKNKGKS